MLKRTLLPVIRSNQLFGKRVPLFVLQKRNTQTDVKVTPLTEDKVIITNGRITTEQFLEGLRKRLGEPPQYTSKFEGQTIEEFENFLNEHYANRNFYVTDDFKEFVRTELLYSKEEIEKTITGNFGSLTIKKDGLEIPNFQPILDFVGVSPFWNSIIAKTETTFTNFREKLTAPLPEPEKKIDWDEAARRLGKEQAAQLRADAEAVKKMFEPELDLDKIEKELRTYLMPYFDRFKDLILSDREDIKKISDELAKECTLLEKDEYGLPKHDVESLEFMTTYFPEELNEIFVEIDNLNFDEEYKDEMRQFAINSPERAQRASQRDAFVGTINETVDEVIKDLGPGALETREKIETPEQIARQQLFVKVNEIARRNKELEIEIGQLKMRLQKDGGGMQEAPTHEKTKKKQQVEVSKDLMDSLIKLLGGDPSKKRVRIKDWKHTAPVIEELDSPRNKEEQQQESKDEKKKE